LYHFEKTNARLTNAQVEALNVAVVSNRDLEVWRKALGVWLLRGYKPTNIEGPLQWYRDGIPQNGKGPPGKGRPVSRESNYDEADLERQRQREAATAWERPADLL
jgi:hypothetical protein